MRGAPHVEFSATIRKIKARQDLSYELLPDLAKRLMLDARELARALETGEFAERVKKDFSGGARSGVNGTPTFFINGQRHDADFELDTAGTRDHRSVNMRSKPHRYARFEDGHGHRTSSSPGIG